MAAVATEALKRQVRALGFDVVGVTPALPAPTLDAYRRWIAAGMHGEMAYMARPDREARRRDLNLILQGVRSIIVVGLDYARRMPPEVLEDRSRGRIAAYAWGTDYHDVIAVKLEALAAWLHDTVPMRHRVYVDTGAILERAHGQAAGLGFIGKNTMLIHPRRGSAFFLGVLLTDLVFDPYDTPLPKVTMCGTCTRCLAACPTDAFPRPHVLDARRCISYLTIEYKGWIAPDLRPKMGNWVFGCDICQDVCPWQRFAPETDEPLFPPPLPDRAAPPLADLLRMDAADFQARFAATPVERIGRERMARNACIAAGNSGDPALIPPLIGLLADATPLVRGHAAWALGRFGDLAREALHTALARETDDRARAEIAAALA